HHFNKFKEVMLMSEVQEVLKYTSEIIRIVQESSEEIKKQVVENLKRRIIDNLTYELHDGTTKIIIDFINDHLKDDIQKILEEAKPAIIEEIKKGIISGVGELANSMIVQAQTNIEDSWRLKEVIRQLFNI